MIERRPVLDFIGHAVLLCGAALVAFPLYIAFVASTQSARPLAGSPTSSASPYTAGTSLVATQPSSRARELSGISKISLLLAQGWPGKLRRWGE